MLPTPALDISLICGRKLSQNDILLSPLYTAAQLCIRSVYTSKIINSERDLLGVVFFGTDKHKNSVNFEHVYVLHELDTPGAKRVLELDKYKGKKGRAYFNENIGHSKDFSLGHALWICANLFSDVKLRMSHKRIMLFTNDDHPHVGDSTKINLAFTKASDLRET
ncbi:X-ray repair cross-complementing protein 6-like, partial [Microcaecilia unicolor]|uniref:X-ray repair cross-complementing protein 6-like n=1 Tax=Microcaecilia unicolor TaxID=1415580 RepID=A0A6P7X1B6_9AMPH